MSLEEKWDSIGRSLLQSEDEAVTRLLEHQTLSESTRNEIVDSAHRLVSRCRARKQERPIVERFLHEYGLTSEEGVAMLCLVEALLRIPDERTAEEFIAEKLRQGDWSSHLGHSDSVFVNASTWALILTGDLIELGDDIRGDFSGWIKRFSSRLGEGITRRALIAAVNILSRSFVAGQTIEEALNRVSSPASFDMLGEGARSYEVAESYYESYVHALDFMSKNRSESSVAAHGLSVKLTALHPKIEPLKERQVVNELYDRVNTLCGNAASAGLELTIDGEEVDRVEINLRLIERLVKNSNLRDWGGLGVVVQAYSKRAMSIVSWLTDLAKANKTRLKVRLVKGAYWDTEIKRAQVDGFTQYPVYTKKENTDLSFLICASALLNSRSRLFPQFATHNAHTIASIRELATDSEFEFQRLHGMGQLLYDEARKQFDDLPICRVYSPVGRNQELMPYLMRRLLENGANTSFVNRIFDTELPIEEVVQDPITLVAGTTTHQHPRIPLPKDLFGDERTNSLGLDFGNCALREPFKANIDSWSSKLLGKIREGTEVINPGDAGDLVGYYQPPDSKGIDARIQTLADEGFTEWSSTHVDDRAIRLDRWADEIAKHRTSLASLIQREAGKTIEDTVNELREAEDFCRYYACEARKLFVHRDLPSPTGESNRLMLHPRGVIACISPWNFPAAIFVGPIAAALVTGNTVAAKPAPQTSLTALELVDLARKAGLNEEILSVFPGDDSVGRSIVDHPRIRGVAFTGSVFAARAIARSLANRDGPLVPLIAETGGVNAMVVDSSAQLEHVVDDIVASAFKSAGQRCSALRLLCVQDEIAESLSRMLRGAMDALRVGDPRDWSIDVGPVIDDEAKTRLESYIGEYNVLHRKDGAEENPGNFVSPVLIEVDDVQSFKTEYFGPILGVHTFARRNLAELSGQLNSLGYGLTFGIHSRRDDTILHFTRSMKAGNIYVNRSMTGAVVGTQPFGGEALSGTGPKAGGPFYLSRFVVERVVTTNETATGGNLSLMRL